MSNARLLATLADHLQTSAAVVWVSVADVHGSAPRAPGARMLVTRSGLCATIGGGTLELRAVEIARQMLDEAAAGRLPPARIERFALGARAGQCCGGVVNLVFDLVTPSDHAWVQEALRLEQQQCDWIRLIELGGRTVLVATPADLAARCVQAAFSDSITGLCAPPGDNAVITSTYASGQSHLLERFYPPELHLALFGAGHVGRALVEVLARLPIRVTWIDSRETEFLAWMPRNTRAVVTDCAQADVHHLPADSAVLITTHSHALDLELVRAWLDRGDFRFLGLIGSRSKRASFEAKLRARGYTRSQIEHLVCPVGDLGVLGKEPEVIALAIAAQLMKLRRIAAPVRPYVQQPLIAATFTP